MSCCRCTAALGGPVVPEVYIQNATSSLVVGAGSSSGHWPATSSLTESQFAGAASRRSATLPSAITTAARVSSNTYSISAGPESGFRGTGTAPILMAPQKAYTNSGPSGRSRGTRSSICTPSRRSALPTRLTWVWTSRYVTRRSSQTSATRSPRPAAMWRSTKWAAALKRRGSASYGSGGSGRRRMVQLGLERHCGRLGLLAGGLEPPPGPPPAPYRGQGQTPDRHLPAPVQHLQ